MKSYSYKGKLAYHFTTSLIWAASPIEVFGVEYFNLAIFNDLQFYIYTMGAKKA